MVRDTHPTSLFDELGDFFEVRMLGGFEQLEEGHFRAADVGALGGKAGQGDLAVLLGGDDTASARIVTSNPPSIRSIAVW